MKIKNILVSQPQPIDFEKSPYGEIARKFNVTITFRKFFIIEGIPAKDFRKDRINILDYSAVIFTSRNAVDHYFRMCKEMRIEVPETMKYFSISESTAYYLQKYVQFRKRKIFHSKENYANLIELIKKHKTEKFLLPCSDIHKQEIPKMLEDNKIQYKKAIIYRTLAADLSDIDISHYDLLVFFSPSGIKSLFKNFPEFVQGETVIGAFGNSTHKALKDAGLILNVEAPTQAAPSMTTAIEQFLQSESKKSNQCFSSDERLSSRRLISKLFASGSTISLKPFRVRWMHHHLDPPVPVQVMMSVPKYNFHRAVDRNLIRRRMREAYRLNKQVLYERLNEKGGQMVVCITYTAKDIVPYGLITGKIILILQRLIEENEKVTG